MIDFVLNNPISCGYLLSFCDTQHNSENLHFIMVVDKFKDNYTDPACWSKPWRDIDEEININEINPGNFSQVLQPTQWPSKVCSSSAMEADVDEIWENYFSDEGLSQICIASEVLRRTRCRIERLHLYGPHVFSEALIDPIKTIARDILPRFLKSELYTTLKLRLSQTDPLPSAANLSVPSPTVSILDDATLDELPESRRFSLGEIIHDRVLYEHFLSYLRQTVSSENLLCVRMIHVFDELIEKGDVEGANQIGWNLYLYFIAPGASLEVSCSYRQRKDVMLKLALLSAGDFDEIKKSALSMLTVNFASFQRTSEYSSLASKMRSIKIQSEIPPVSKSRFSCLGVVG